MRKRKRKAPPSPKKTPPKVKRKKSGTKPTARKPSKGVKRKPSKRVKRKTSTRSKAAKKGWTKRRKRDRLVMAMRAKGWRETEMPTKEELVDYLSFLSSKYKVELSDMYRMYFGYEVGEVA